jgi:hypothetical protein
MSVHGSHLDLVSAGQMAITLSEYVAQVTGSDASAATDKEQLAEPPDALKGTVQNIVLSHAARTANSESSGSVTTPVQNEQHVRECVTDCDHVHERQACVSMCKRVRHNTPSTAILYQQDADQEATYWGDDEHTDDGDEVEGNEIPTPADHAEEELTEAQLKQLAAMIGLKRPPIHPHSAAILSGVSAPSPRQ